MAFVSNQTANSTGPGAVTTGSFGTVELLGIDSLPIRAWRIRQAQCTIGSGAESNLRIESSALASVHLALSFGRRHVLAKAVSGSFWVNGRSVREWLFDSACDLNLGSLVLRVVPSYATPMFPANSSSGSSRKTSPETTFQTIPVQVNPVQANAAQANPVQVNALQSKPASASPSSARGNPNPVQDLAKASQTNQAPTPGSQAKRNPFSSASFDPELASVDDASSIESTESSESVERLLPQVEKLVQSFFEPLMGAVDQLRTSVEQVKEQANVLSQEPASYSSHEELLRVEANLSERLDQRISSLLSEMDRLREENNSLQRSFAESDRALEESLRTQIRDSERRLSEFDLEISQLREERDFAIARIDQLVGEVDSTRQESERMTGEDRQILEAQRAEHQALLLQLSQLDERLRIVQASADQSSSEWESASRELHNQVQYWQSHASSLQETVSQQSQQLAQLEQMLRDQALRQESFQPNPSQSPSSYENSSSSVPSMLASESIDFERDHEVSQPGYSNRDRVYEDVSRQESDDDGELFGRYSSESEESEFVRDQRDLTPSQEPQIDPSAFHDQFQPSRASEPGLSFADIQRQSVLKPASVDRVDRDSDGISDDDHSLSMALIASLQRRSDPVEELTKEPPFASEEAYAEEEVENNHPHDAYGSRSYQGYGAPTDDVPASEDEEGSLFGAYTDENDPFTSDDREVDNREVDNLEVDNRSVDEYASQEEDLREDESMGSSRGYPSQVRDSQDSRARATSIFGGYSAEEDSTDGEIHDDDALDSEEEASPFGSHSSAYGSSASRQSSYGQSYASELEEEGEEPAPYEEVESPISRAVETSHASSDADNEDSIEEYMQQLLQRVRGTSSSTSSTVSKATVTKAPITEPRPAKKATLASTELSREEPRREDTRRDSANRDIAGRELEPVSTKSAPAVKQNSDPFDPATYVPRQQAPERNRDMAAMRELANVTARTAIERSDRRKLGSEAFFKVTVTLIGFIGGVSLLAINGFKMNMALVGSLAGFVIAGLWGMESISLVANLLNHDPDEEVDSQTAQRPDGGKKPSL